MKKKIFIGKRFLMVFAITFTEDYAHHSGIYEAGETYHFETNVTNWDDENRMKIEIYHDLKKHFGLADETNLPINPPLLVGGRETTPCIYIPERRLSWLIQKQSM